MSAFLDENGNLVVPSAANPLPVTGGGGGGSSASSNEANILNGDAYTFNVAASLSAGLFTASQLKNPSGSGKKLIVRRCDIYVGATAFVVFKGISDLTNANAAVPTNQLIGSSKTSVAQAFTDALSVLQVPEFQVLAQTGASLATGGYFNVLNGNTFVIEEGQSIVVVATPVARNFTAQWQYDEVSA